MTKHGTNLHFLCYFFIRHINFILKINASKRIKSCRSLRILPFGSQGSATRTHTRTECLPTAYGISPPPPAARGTEGAAEPTPARAIDRQSTSNQCLIWSTERGLLSSVILLLLNNRVFFLILTFFFQSLFFPCTLFVRMF